MKKLIYLPVFLCFIMFLAIPALASTIHYSITSNLDFNDNLGSDTLGLEGGTLKLEFILDSNISPDILTSYDGFDFGYYENITTDLSLIKSNGTLVFDQIVQGIFEVIDYTLDDQNKYDASSWHISNINIQGGLYRILTYIKFKSDFINSVDLFTFNNTDVISFDSDIYELDAQGNMADHIYYPAEPQSAAASLVPEPSTILLLGSGLIGLVIYARKRNRA